MGNKDEKKKKKMALEVSEQVEWSVWMSGERFESGGRLGLAGSRVSASAITVELCRNVAGKRISDYRISSERLSEANGGSKPSFMPP
ncbi:hypothetical protein LSTR_LSTR006892 [Laodelphax striatellus]|uniref:Uncharacterized protein n=1 Tax=Laodelphax striatellus TaxID=195883 RepID=A0A482WL53_LAOST|nr:hypothetical protein LSTR_LSTR006892 [Laodelphax striatellus]